MLAAIGGMPYCIRHGIASGAGVEGNASNEPPMEALREANLCWRPAEKYTRINISKSSANKAAVEFKINFKPPLLKYLLIRERPSSEIKYQKSAYKAWR